MSVLLEDHLPVVKYEGLNTNKAVVLGSTLSVAGAVTATGGVAGAVDATTVSASGVITAQSDATVPATAGAVAAGIPVQLFLNGPSIYVTSDAPTFTAVKGSLCINTGGSSTSTRLYVNNGTTNWVAMTSAS